MTDETLNESNPNAKSRQATQSTRPHVDNGHALIVPEIGLTEINGEPRARDVDLADRLGFERPRDIRKLVERNLAEIEAFGTCATVARVVRGNPVSERWLNEEQALLVAILSDAPNAPAVRAMLIKTFVAWRRGHLIPASYDGLSGENRKIIGGIVKSVIHKEVSDLLPAMVEAAIAADPRRAALNYVSVRQLLEEAKALQKGRDRVNRKIGFELSERARKEGVVCLKCPNSGVWLYPRMFAGFYMAERGKSLVADHNDNVSGQGVIKFPTPKRPEQPTAEPT